MMENKSDKGGFWKRQSFLLPPLTAAVVLLCQQMASSNPSGVVTVNILLLVLNFFSYVGLLRGEKSTEKSVAIAAAGFITLMAFVFNTCVAGIPTPLSDTGIFMNSLCGMWVLVAVVQGISLLIQAVVKFFLINGLIAGIQDYSVQFLLTEGGPGYDTMVPGYYMYQAAFQSGRMGYASAIGTFLFAVIMLFTLLAFRLGKKNQGDQI